MERIKVLLIMVFTMVLSFFIPINTAQAEEIVSSFIYPVGSEGELQGYRIDQYFNNSYAEGYCSVPPYTQSSSECTGTWMYGHDGLDINGDDGGNTDCDQPVYASADGLIVNAEFENGWGRQVRIQHLTTDGYRYTLYGHLHNLQVSYGQTVFQGQWIADIGGNLAEDGNSGGCHLHFGVLTDNQNGSGYYYGSAPPFHLDPVDFIASHQIDCTDYASEIDDVKDSFGIFIGDAEGDLSVYDSTSNVCRQDYDASGTSSGTSAILFDSEGGANQAYLVRSGFWSYYSGTCGGPEGWSCRADTGNVRCGAPIGNEYAQGNNAWQDFQGCYLYWNGTTASANGYPAATPGLFADDTYDSVSYAFAEAYETNGARNTLGEAYDIVDGPYVHHWGNDESLPYVQDFEGGDHYDNGTYGWSILMYNEELESAFAIHTDFWEQYAYNGGPDEYGAPCTDEYEGSDGYTYQEFERSLFLWKNGQTYTRQQDSNCSARSISSTSASTASVYTSLDLSAQAPVDWADPTASPACMVDETTGTLHVVFSTESGRIQELTYNGTSWTSLDLSAQAAVAYASLGTSPRIFSHPDTGERFVVFTGDNRRLYLLRSNTGTWSSIDLSSQAAVDWADLDAEPFGFIHPVTTYLHVVFSTESGRIQELTYDGNYWTSLDLSAQASVPYASLGTSPVAFPNPQSTERFVVFNGNGRIQLLRSNTGTWSSLDVSAQAAVDYADLDSSPFGYITSDASLLAILLNTQGDRIQQLTYDGNYWRSLDLSGQTAVSYSDPGTSPVEMTDRDVPSRAIVFMGEGGRLQQFTTDGSTWSSVDLSSQAPVDFAASGTSPGVCLDPVTQTRYVVFTTTGKRIQLIQYGP